MYNNTLYGLALVRSWRNNFDIDEVMLAMMRDINETFRKAKSKKTDQLVFLQHRFLNIWRLAVPVNLDGFF